jgi:ABC-2 type transport system permease protein
MIRHLARGATLVAAQEFRVRLRTGRWRWLLCVWVLVLAVFTGLLDTALSVSDSGPRGVPLFGLLMLFVLMLMLVISPALTAQSVNGDRERGTLATLQITLLSPTQIALGKLFAAWAVGLVALALTLPFVGWAMLAGGLTAARVVGVFVIDALLVGVVCAISQALSALLARTITSALLSYVVVAAMSIGTVIAFAVASPLVAEHRVGSGGYEETVSRPDRVWWLLAPNPFVVLADAAPRLPPQVVVTERGPEDKQPDDPLRGLGQQVRRLRLPPGASDSDTRLATEGLPVWPYGLGFDLLVAAGAVWVTVRRLRAPSRRLAPGVRVG